MKTLKIEDFQLAGSTAPFWIRWTAPANTVAYNYAVYTADGTIVAEDQIKRTDMDLVGLKDRPGKYRIEITPVDTKGFEGKTTSAEVTVSDSGLSAFTLLSAKDTLLPSGSASSQPSSAPPEPPRSQSSAHVRLSHIEISSPPDKKVYKVGEKFDSIGLSIEGTYSDGSRKPIDLHAVRIDFDSSKPTPDLIVTISVGIIRAFLHGIQIVDLKAPPPPKPSGPKKPEIVDVEIEKPPHKTVYKVGESLDRAGLVLRAIYSDGSTKQVGAWSDGISIPRFDSSTPAPQLPVVVWLDKVSTSFDVCIEAPTPTLESIRIVTPPTKRKFNVGDAMVPADLAGLVVVRCYSDGTERQEAIIRADVSGFNSSAPMTGQPITVTVAGKTATYTVDIVDPVDPAGAPLPAHPPGRAPAAQNNRPNWFTRLPWGKIGAVLAALAGLIALLWGYGHRHAIGRSLDGFFNESEVTDNNGSWTDKGHRAGHSPYDASMTSPTARSGSIASNITMSPIISSNKIGTLAIIGQYTVGNNSGGGGILSPQPNIGKWPDQTKHHFSGHVPAETNLPPSIQYERTNQRTSSPIQCVRTNQPGSPETNETIPAPSSSPPTNTSDTWTPGSWQLIPHQVPPPPVPPPDIQPSIVCSESGLAYNDGCPGVYIGNRWHSVELYANGYFYPRQVAPYRAPNPNVRSYPSPRPLLHGGFVAMLGPRSYARGESFHGSSSRGGGGHR